MRINNYIKTCGVCSRREADNLIESGRVLVNGKLAEIGMEINAKDVVLVDNKKINLVNTKVYLLLNKPIGIETTAEKKKNNIIDFVGFKERLFPVGRLDKDSCGIIILTNDGDIVNDICRVENNHEKEYLVMVDKPLDMDFKYLMEKGVKIYNPAQNRPVVTKKCMIKIVNSTTFKITITQGLNRQIRRMCKELGYNVTYLERIRIMNISDSHLKKGEYRMLTSKEIRDLKELLKINQRET